MFRVIMNMYSGNRAYVKVHNFHTRSFKINSGIQQGSKLGPLLFNIFINDLLKGLKDNFSGVPLGGEVSLVALLYADDLVIFSNHASYLNKILEYCNMWAKANKMIFNIGKSRVLIFFPKHSEYKFRMSCKMFEVVDLHFCLK